MPGGWYLMPTSYCWPVSGAKGWPVAVSRVAVGKNDSE